MNSKVLGLVCLLLAGVLGYNDDWNDEDIDRQKWSKMTYRGDPYTFHCKDDIESIHPQENDSLVWMKHDSEIDPMTDSHYEIHHNDESNIHNFALTIKNVEEDTEGIYFCVVNEHMRIIKGLNLGGPKYSRGIDHYDRNVIVGIISGASVFVLVVGFGLIKKYQYLTDEQKEKKRQRKADWQARKQNLKNGLTGMDNSGMDMSEVNGKSNEMTEINGGTADINTHL